MPPRTSNAKSRRLIRLSDFSTIGDRKLPHPGGFREADEGGPLARYASSRKSGEGKRFSAYFSSAVASSSHSERFCKYMFARR